jgi:hypothetical protein
MLLRYSLRAEETKAVVVASIIMMLVFGIQLYAQQTKDNENNTFCDNGKSEGWVEGYKQGWYE